MSNKPTGPTGPVSMAAKIYNGDGTKTNVSGGMSTGVGDDPRMAGSQAVGGESETKPAAQVQDTKKEEVRGDDDEANPGKKNFDITSPDGSVKDKSKEDPKALLEKKKKSAAELFYPSMKGNE